MESNHDLGGRNQVGLSMVLGQRRWKTSWSVVCRLRCSSWDSPSPSITPASSSDRDTSVLGSRLSTFHHSLSVWIPRSTLTSASSLHLEAADLDVSRGRTPRRVRLVEKMLAVMRIKLFCYLIVIDM